MRGTQARKVCVVLADKVTATLPACSHHICLEVDDIKASMAHVGQRVRLLSQQAKIGAHGLPVVFLHPKDMAGVLTELEQVSA
jgi:methylmalonyl-CoA epimerase